MAPKRPPKVTLHSMAYSHHCVKAQKLLDLKGVAYEVVEVPYHDKRALLKASGQDYVPFLQWGDKGVPWHQIVDFVEQQVPQPTAFPGGRRGEARILEQWGHDQLEEVVWRYVLPEMPATFKDEHERWVFEEMQIRKRGSLELMKARQAEFLADVKQHVALVELALENGPWVMGDAPSVADFAIYGALLPIEHVGKELPREFKRTREWYDRVTKV